MELDISEFIEIWYHRKKKAFRFRLQTIEIMETEKYFLKQVT
jgi:hypothetical protein